MIGARRPKAGLEHAIWRKQKKPNANPRGLLLYGNNGQPSCL